jgi:hypothetical protein
MYDIEHAVRVHRAFSKGLGWAYVDGGGYLTYTSNVLVTMI